MKKYLIIILLAVFLTPSIMLASNEPTAEPFQNILWDFSAGAGYFKESHATFGTITEYWGYKGVYPDTSNEGTHQTGSFNFSTLNFDSCETWDGGTYEGNCWFRFKVSGTDYAYQGFWNGGTWGQEFADGIRISSPYNTQTLADFPYFTVEWGGITEDFFQLGIHYSEDLTVLEACEEFPWGVGAGYTECINDDPRIYADYGIATTLDDGTVNIYKTNPFTVGKTYYAQAVIQEEDQYGINVAVSEIISFTIGVPEEESGLVMQECETFNIFCHLKNFGIWLFGVSSENLNQFSELTLENNAPFSYIYDLGNLWDDLFDQTASETFDLTLNLGTFGEITILSEEIIDEIPFWGTIYNLLSLLLYFSTAIFLYHKIINVHDNSHKTTA